MSDSGRMSSCRDDFKMFFKHKEGQIAATVT